MCPNLEEVDIFLPIFDNKGNVHTYRFHQSPRKVEPLVELEEVGL